MRYKQFIFLAVIFTFVILIALPFGHAGQPALPPDTVADHILVDKSDRTLTIFKEGRVLKIYPVSLGRGGLAKKAVEGDKLTPEGHYKITRRKDDSAFYKALHISYPNEEDKRNAKKLGKKPGGHIMIHGHRVGFFGKSRAQMDWTQGCIAVTNKQMDELWRSVPIGTTIEIRP